MSLVAATWTGAIATVLLVLGAAATALYARNAYREQSRQTREIREQTRLLQEQADRDIKQRHRAQATQVFTWVEMRPFDGKADDMRSAACIMNASAHPVYDIELGLGSRPVLTVQTGACPCSCRARITSGRALGRTR